MAGKSAYERTLQAVRYIMMESQALYVDDPTVRIPAVTNITAELGRLQEVVRRRVDVETYEDHLATLTAVLGGSCVLPGQRSEF